MKAKHITRPGLIKYLQVRSGRYLDSRKHKSLAAPLGNSCTPSHLGRFVSSTAVKYVEPFYFWYPWTRGIQTGRTGGHLIYDLDPHFPLLRCSSRLKHGLDIVRALLYNTLLRTKTTMGWLSKKYQELQNMKQGRNADGTLQFSEEDLKKYTGVSCLASSLTDR